MMVDTLITVAVSGNGKEIGSTSQEILTLSLESECLQQWYNHVFFELINLQN